MEINDQIAELFGFCAPFGSLCDNNKTFCNVHSSFIALNFFAESFKANKRKMKLFWGREGRRKGKSGK
jgi:hypothetical protein